MLGWIYAVDFITVGGRAGEIVSRRETSLGRLPLNAGELEPGVGSPGRRQNSFPFQKCVLFI